MEPFARIDPRFDAIGKLMAERRHVEATHAALEFWRESTPAGSGACPPPWRASFLLDILRTLCELNSDSRQMCIGFAEHARDVAENGGASYDDWLLVGSVACPSAVHRWLAQSAGDASQLSGDVVRALKRAKLL
jgi:hypothetical protein